MKDTYKVDKSRIEGEGGFAIRDIKKGETIAFFEGDYVNTNEINNRIATGEERLDDPLQVDDDAFIDLDKKYLYLNHSCNPNSGFKGINELIALRKITKGEEITYDYSAVVPKNNDWTMKCKCGAENCRKIVGNITTIPKEQLQLYLDAGTVQDYLRKSLQIS